MSPERAVDSHEPGKWRFGLRISMDAAEDPERYYIEVIMQEKIRLYLEYVKNASFWYDLRLIFQTFWVIVRE